MILSFSSRLLPRKMCASNTDVVVDWKSNHLYLFDF